MRECIRCHTGYPDELIAVMFRTTGLMHQTRNVCVPCEETAVDQHKQQNRWTVKARDTIRRHAQRLDIDKTKLIEVYGWDPKLLAHDMQHAYKNGCRYCHELYSTMPHGLSDITLDIIRPSEEPYYAINCTWCCQTCNRAKSNMKAENWEKKRRGYRIRREFQNRMPEDRFMLF
jgi:hypothetical protein